MLWIIFLSMSVTMFFRVEAIDVANQQISSPGICNILCQQGTKCVLIEPNNCYGCIPQAQCVQQECNTTCILPCPSSYRCALVISPSGCCPVASCRPSTSTPLYTSTPPYTNPFYTSNTPYSIPSFPTVPTNTPYSIPPFPTVPTNTVPSPFSFWPFNFPFGK
ncbi:hypothetical protein V3C99_001990 [Haemonchus contortus]